MNFLGFQIESTDNVGTASTVRVYDSHHMVVYRYETSSAWTYLKAQWWCLLHFWRAG
jgi:hypothetical protein